MATYNWIGGFSRNDFLDPLNWNPSHALGTSDDANFLVFIQTSGTADVIGALNLGNNAGLGTYGMSGGDLTAGSISIGNSQGEGTFTQTNGVVTVGDSSNPSQVDIGNTGTGTYTIAAAYDDGSGSFTTAPGLNVTGDVAIGVGLGSTGKMVIGTAELDPSVAADDPTFVSVSSGADESGGGDFTVGDAGNGTLFMESGLLSVELNLNIGVNGQGSVIQNGGTVSAAFVDMSTAVGSGSSSYTINGGELDAADVNVGGGGAGPAIFTETAARFRLPMI
jgi:hypothetical protein